jgi:hypothetical protein
MIRKGIALIIMLLFIGLIISPSSSKIMSFDDTTPPFTTIYFDPTKPNGNNGWYLQKVLVVLEAVDNESGVNATYYRINDGEWSIYTNQFQIQEEGIFVIEFYSVDTAGNKEEIKSSEVKIDKEYPIIYTERELIKKDIVRCTAYCYDYISGMDRVEFYCDHELVYTDYKEPYEWIWDYSKSNLTDVFAYDKAGHMGYDPPYNITPLKVIGFILNPEYYEYKVSFYALLVYTSRNEKFTFEKMNFIAIGSIGYIGKFFIRALFKY